MNPDKLNELLEMDVSEYTKKKKNLTYLSWANAWTQFIKVYPEATYKIKKDENMKCWFGNDNSGYMVYTEVTAGNITHEMWLPVMDYNNISMKSVQYEAIQYGKKKKVQAMSTFDINKAVMRCLTKNLAMFGLGLYIYAGEDLPEEPEEPVKKKVVKQTKKPLDPAKVKALYTLATKKGLVDAEVKAGIKKYYNATSTKDLTIDNFNDMMKRLKKIEDKGDKNEN